MKKAWILPPISVAISLVFALAVTRWFAPQLLGLPPDLQMVQVADRIAPFFDDPLDSFRLAYSNDRWLDLRPDRS